MKLTKLIIFSIATGAVFALILFYFSQQKNPSEKTLISSPTKTIEKLDVLSVNPLSGGSQIVFPNIAITIIFTKDINIDSLRVFANPAIEFITELKAEDQRVLYIKPKGNWVFNQRYEFTISVSSRSGEILENYKYSFEPQRPASTREEDYGDYGI